MTIGIGSNGKDPDQVGFPNSLETSAAALAAALRLEAALDTTPEELYDALEATAYPIEGMDISRMEDGFNVGNGLWVNSDLAKKSSLLVGHELRLECDRSHTS
jgi:hypothetical protein